MALPSSPLGSSRLPPDESNLLTTTTWQLALPSGDTQMTSVFACGYCRRIVPQGSGTLYVQRFNDAVMTSYLMTSGQPLDGLFKAVGGTTTGSSSITVNLEV